MWPIIQRPIFNYTPTLPIEEIRREFILSGHPLSEAMKHDIAYQKNVISVSFEGLVDCYMGHNQTKKFLFSPRWTALISNIESSVR